MAIVFPVSMTSFLTQSIKMQPLISTTRSAVATTCQFKRINNFSTQTSGSRFLSTTLRSNQSLPQHRINTIPSTSCRMTQPTLLSNAIQKVPAIYQSQSRNQSGVSGIGSGSRNSGSSAGTSTLPPSFRTGTKWDMPGRPTDATTAKPTSLLTRPIVPTPRAWDTLKESENVKPVHVEDSQANIEANLKKLSAIAKGTNKKQAYSPYMLISQLPPTVTPDDIRRMADSKDSIKDIIFHRNQFMEFQNKVTVVFRSATDAVDFITQKYGKFLGGHKINMNMLDPYDTRDKRWIPPQLRSEPFSGLLVLVSGLPASSRPDHLRTGFRRFQLLDTTEAAIIPVPSKRLSTSCQYLIRFSSRSEAFRFIRTYHNTYFQFQEFRKRCPIRTTIIY